MPRRNPSPWRKRNHGGASGRVDYVLDELERRVLSDVETCREVWDHESDPLAVAVAITFCDVPESRDDRRRLNALTSLALAGAENRTLGDALLAVGQQFGVVASAKEERDKDGAQ